MQSKFLRAICVLACFALAAPLFAQYGHPLKGTFSGDFWIQKGKETHITIEFNYDGDKDLVVVRFMPSTQNVRFHCASNCYRPAGNTRRGHLRCN